MKRIISIFFVFLLVSMLFVSTAFAAATYTGDVDSGISVLLIDADTGSELYAQNKDERIEPASTTKILTCILAIEQCGMDDEVTISTRAAAATTGSHLGLSDGQKISMKDLLTGMMLVSGNDAAIAVAEHVSGSVADFVTLMNQKAQELGMTSTQFANPNGLHDDNHYSTASDMAKLTEYAMQNETFRSIVGLHSYDMPDRNDPVKNTNALLDPESQYYYSNATGVKTGSTPKAGSCLVASASKDDMNLICLIYKDESDEAGTARWPLAKGLFDWGFENYETVDAASVLASAPMVQVQIQDASAADESGGLLDFPASGITGKVTLEKSVYEGLQDGTYTITATPAYTQDAATAPVEKNDILGTVTYSVAETGVPLLTTDLTAARDVAEYGSDAGVSGGTAVATLPPTAMEDIVTTEDNASIWLWLLIPAALVIFLVVRLVTVNRRKRKRWHRRPHYSYKIK